MSAKKSTLPRDVVNDSPPKGGDDLNLSTTAARARVDMPCDPKPKMNLVKVHNVSSYVSFTGPDGRKVHPGGACWLNEKEAGPLVRRGIVEIVERETL